MGALILCFVRSRPIETFGYLLEEGLRILESRGPPMAFGHGSRVLAVTLAALEIERNGPVLFLGMRRAGAAGIVFAWVEPQRGKVGRPGMSSDEE